MEANDGQWKIVGKYHPIWTEIAKVAEQIKTPTALYTYVCNDICNIRTLLEADKQTPGEISADSCTNTLNTTSEASETSLEVSSFESGVSFTIRVSAEEFENLLTEKAYYIKSTFKARKVVRLKPGRYKILITRFIQTDFAKGVFTLLDS